MTTLDEAIAIAIAKEGGDLAVNPDQIVDALIEEDKQIRLKQWKKQ